LSLSRTNNLNKTVLKIVCYNQPSISEKKTDVSSLASQIELGKYAFHLILRKLMSPKTTGHRKHIIYQFVSRKFFLETFENLHNYFVALSNYFKQLTKCWLQYPCCDLCDFLLSFSVICWVVIWGFSHVSDCLLF